MKLLTYLNNKLDLKKPHALTWDEWDDWRDNTKRERPVAYFIMETLPDFGHRIWDKISSPFNSFRYYLKNRFFDRYHLINTRLPYGYHETSERMLHGAFSLLVDYVELELAQMHYISGGDIKRPWWSTGVFPIKSFRFPVAGLDYLVWEASLANSPHATHQATKAVEVLDLYIWWTKVRPLRQDPWVLSGSDQFWKNRSIKDILSDKNKNKNKDKKLQDQYAKLDHEIEMAFLDEDHKQLERLIKIRHYLWT